MSNTIFDQSSGDLSDSAENSSTVTRKKDPNSVYHLKNTTDVDVDFTLQATYAEDADNFNDTVDLETVTVTSSGDDVDYMTLNSDSWEELRVQIDPNGNPSSGDVQVRRLAEI
jgi:hypothetical protein